MDESKRMGDDEVLSNIYNEATTNMILPFMLREMGASIFMNIIFLVSLLASFCKEHHLLFLTQLSPQLKRCMVTSCTFPKISRAGRKQPPEVDAELISWYLTGVVNGPGSGGEKLLEIILIINSKQFS